MKKIFLKASLLVLAGFFITSCNNDNNSSEVVTKKEVIRNYADIAYANYKQAYDDAVVLETAINTFTATPTDANFAIAKDKWKAARESYGTTEAFRFANGPIDNEDGPEGLLNSWPLDENFIDYVDGDSNAGIINHIAQFPTLSKQVLEDENALDIDEKNVSVGYHAIEFLLWGQDLTAPSEKLPGQRKYTDYVVGSPEATNQARRAQYLNICADLITDHLDYLVQQWKPGGAYRTIFLALPENDALKNMYLGITTLVNSELPVERMQVALTNHDQEDEHSCFSDNTNRDVRLNLEGIVNVYQGKYGTIDGPSLEDLVKAANTEAYNSTATAVNTAVSKMELTANPFDFAISGGIESVEGAKVNTAIEALFNLGANLLNGATKIGITVNG